MPSWEVSASTMFCTIINVNESKEWEIQNEGRTRMRRAIVQSDSLYSGREVGSYYDHQRNPLPSKGALLRGWCPLAANFSITLAWNGYGEAIRRTVLALSRCLGANTARRVVSLSDHCTFSFPAKSELVFLSRKGNVEWSDRELPCKSFSQRISLMTMIFLRNSTFNLINAWRRIQWEALTVVQ